MWSSDRDNWLVLLRLYKWWLAISPESEILTKGKRSKKCHVKKVVYFGQFLTKQSKANRFLWRVENSTFSWCHFWWAEIQGSNVYWSRGNVVHLSCQLNVATFRQFHIKFGCRGIADWVMVNRAGEESAAGIVTWSFAHLFLSMKSENRNGILIPPGFIFSVSEGRVRFTYGCVCSFIESMEAPQVIKWHTSD